MIDRSHVGLELPVVHWPVEKGRLLAFARAIGETRPEYTDEAAAIAAATCPANSVTKVRSPVISESSA